MAEAITFQHYEVLVREDGSPWELGRGAMGVTYKALDTNLRVPVALKVIHPRQLDSELVAQRFVREARAAARLRHPHIAAVYHLGQEGENWFYAMEFVAGDTAEELVKRDGPLPEALVLGLAIQAARALHAADALGLVHRDIKPSNLMLTRDGDEWQLKVIDFGLARTFTGGEDDEDLAAVTHSGFVGTPYYASPEQLEQKELNIRSDIYSLGVTMWFLLTGKVPFTGSVVSVLSQHLHKEPPFEHLEGRASPNLRSLLERMLAKDPASRPQTALDLRRELEQCNCAPQAGAATSAATSASPSAAPPTEEEIETIVAPLPTVAPVAFTPGESQFDAAETVAEFGFGQLCRARERVSGEPFAILRLGPLHGLEDSAAVQLRETIERARLIEHPQVWRVHALETDSSESRIVMNWTDGYSWRDLLRRHRELETTEAFRLLAQAAGGIDAILAAGIDQPDVSLAGLWCEAPASDALPSGVKVSPLGILRTFSLDATWIGEGTIAGPGATGPETGARGGIRGLAQVAYETLGGAVTAPGFPPLPSLSEGANKVLRTALREPGEFASASALIEQLALAHSEPAPVAPFRTQPAATRQAATHVPPPAVESSAPAQLPPAELDDATHVTQSVPVAIDTPLAELPPPPLRSPERSSPASRPSSRRWSLAAGFAVIAGTAWFIFQQRDDSHSEPVTSAVSVVPTAIAPKPERPTTAPVPSAVGQSPTATASPISTPTREKVAADLQRQAALLREKGRWKEAARTLLKMREEFPEYRAANVDLELLFRDLRWRYTPYRDQPAELKYEEVEALRPELEEAERAGIIAARMLLGEHLSTKKDWPKAIEYYEKARDHAPKATTRIGLLYARFSNKAEELAKAWQYLQAAHQAGDLDGKIAVAECLLYGDFGGEAGGKIVPGLTADEQRGVQMLREVISMSPSRQAPAELANAQLAETYVSEPNRSKLVLGNWYLNQEMAPASQPEWYRQEKTPPETRDHGKEMRRLLDEAKEDWSDAYAFLGTAAALGIGGKVDRAAAETYFQQGAAKGNAHTMFNYAQFLTIASRDGKIPEQARGLLSRAAEKGHPKAIDLCKEHNIAFKQKAAP